MAEAVAFRDQHFGHTVDLGRGLTGGRGRAPAQSTVTSPSALAAVTAFAVASSASSPELTSAEQTSSHDPFSLSFDTSSSTLS
ncbi:hypothetical protein, partial [Maritimibacter alkaliphilus]|uniref:hypothetical protein n=1 Tax=Maritimibacter alkaliphilus TaxID=404236 RepID=UPI0020C81F14